MNSIEQYQNHLKQHGEATMASAGDLAKHFQANRGSPRRLCQKIL
jgi:hypothetical protein